MSLDATFDHPHLVRIVNTDTWDSDIPGAAYYDYNTRRHLAWHVTDTPENVIEMLRRGGRIVAAYGPKGEHAELGPGLYLSDRPDYWVNRHRGKWDFLKQLSARDLQRLVAAIATEIKRDRSSHLISVSEYDYAMRDLDQVAAGRYDVDVLVQLSGQPYNVRFWSPEFLDAIGISAGQAPRAVEVTLRGRFAEVRYNQPSPELVRQLRRAGVAGMYTRPSMGTDGQLVLWDPRAATNARTVTLKP